MIGALQHIFILFARVLLSAVFLGSGVMHVMQWEPSVQMLSEAVQQDFRYDLAPYAAPLMGAAVGCMFVGGLSVLIGWKGRFGAFLLIIFLIPTTLLFHDFWRIDPSMVTEQTNQAQHLVKNAGILGGLLLILGFGSGGFSFDSLLRAKDAITNGPR